MPKCITRYTYWICHICIITAVVTYADPLTDHFFHTYQAQRSFEVYMKASNGITSESLSFTVDISGLDCSQPMVNILIHIKLNKQKWQSCNSWVVFQLWIVFLLEIFWRGCKANIYTRKMAEFCSSSSLI